MDDIEKQITALKNRIGKDILHLYDLLTKQAQNVADTVDYIEDKVPVADREGLFLNYKGYLNLINKMQEVYDKGYNALAKLLKRAYTQKEQEQQEKHDEKLRQVNKEHKIELEKLKAEYERAKKDTEAEKKTESEIHSIERKKLNEEIKGLKAEIDELNKRVKDAEAEADRVNLELKFKTKSLETCKKDIDFLCEGWANEQDAREKEKTKRRPKITAGKTAALPPSVIEEIIKLYCQGLSKHKTAKKLEGKATRNQVYRVLNGDYKNNKSIEKIKKVVRGLKKKNQNPEFLKKLDVFLSSYSTPQPPNQSL